MLNLAKINSNIFSKTHYLVGHTEDSEIMYDGHITIFNDGRVRIELAQKEIDLFNEFTTLKAGIKWFEELTASKFVVCASGQCPFGMV